MIKVTFFQQGGTLTGFRAEGHAMFADSGSDIVCAAVSALLISCNNGLETVAGITPVTQMDEEAGFLSLNLPGSITESQAHDAQVILRVAQVGIQGIAQQYPGHVRASSKNRR